MGTGLRQSSSTPVSNIEAPSIWSPLRRHQFYLERPAPTLLYISFSIISPLHLSVDILPPSSYTTTSRPVYRGYQYLSPDLALHYFHRRLFFESNGAQLFQMVTFLSGVLKRCSIASDDSTYILTPGVTYFYLLGISVGLGCWGLWSFGIFGVQTIYLIRATVSRVVWRRWISVSIFQFSSSGI